MCFLRPAFVMSIVRLLDKLEPTDAQVAALLLKYKPNLVVLPDIVSQIVSLYASKGRVYKLGMIRSWDN